MNYLFYLWGCLHLAKWANIQFLASQGGRGTPEQGVGPEGLGGT